MSVWHLQDKCHPQTIEVCRTRAEGLGLDVVVGDESTFKYDSSVFGVLVQQPATDGSIKDYKVMACCPPMIASATASSAIFVAMLRVGVDQMHARLLLASSNCNALTSGLPVLLRFEV